MKQSLALAVVMLTIGLPASSGAQSNAAKDGSGSATDSYHSSPKAPSNSPAPSFLVHHQLDADVSNVDRDAGVLLLKTDAGRLTLDGAGKAIGVLRKGDRVVLDIALLRPPDPARMPRAERAHPPVLVRQLSAEVTAVQRSIETVSLKSPAGRLNISLPSAALAALRTGDRLLLRVAVLQESDPAALPRADNRRRAGVLGFLLGLFEAARGGARSGP